MCSYTYLFRTHVIWFFVLSAIWFFFSSLKFVSSFYVCVCVCLYVWMRLLFVSNAHAFVEIPHITVVIWMWLFVKFVFFIHHRHDHLCTLIGILDRFDRHILYHYGRERSRTNTHAHTEIYYYFCHFCFFSAIAKIINFCLNRDWCFFFVHFF